MASFFARAPRLLPWVKSHRAGERADSDSHPPTSVVDNVSLKELEQTTEPQKAALSPSDMAESLALANLLNNLSELARLLLGELHRRAWLNAFLLAAGMNQIAEDYTHRDLFKLARISVYLARLPRPLGSWSGRLLRSVGITLARLQQYRLDMRRVLQWQKHLAAFVLLLANASLDRDANPSDSDSLVRMGEDVIARMEELPASLLREVLRLPSCFRSFDQEPADLERIVVDFSQRWPDTDRPLAIVGIRTSGSYLAPLYAALLQKHGYRKVESLCFRPGRKFSGFELAQLRTVIQGGGLVLLTDDPPDTGGSLARAGQELEESGVPASSIILLLQLFGRRENLPARLSKYLSVLLPWEEWTIQKKLTPACVRALGADLFGSTVTIRQIDEIPTPPRRTIRSHAYRAYRVHLEDPASGRAWTQDLFAKGVGLGYFGEHSLVVAQRLHGFVPRVFGLRDGVLYREWLPEESRLTHIPPGKEASLSHAMAAYVVARNIALPVPEDVSLHLSGQSPVWEIASNLLAHVFRRGWLFARLPVIDPVVQRLLRVEHSSVIDGSMALSHWFMRDSGDGALRKVDFDEHAFSNKDLYCYDPIFDLVGLAVSFADRHLPFTEELRRAYEDISGQQVHSERWLLYELVHLWDMQRSKSSDPMESRRGLTHAFQDYFANTYLDDIPTPASGPVCALDVDGVLETEQLGFPSITPAGALALRALLVHGYRPVLVTGRSLREARERCAAYHLPGASAEYGAVVYNHMTGQFRHLLTESERADLDRLRLTLSRMKGVHLDPDYANAVRAFRLDSVGRRHGLSRELIADALKNADLQERVRPILGQSQTDLIASRIDKSVGLAALLDLLGAGKTQSNAKPIALAVGDTVSDLGVFGMAERAYAPANADIHVQSARVPVLGRPYQAGLAEAVAHLLKHAPGACPVCRLPPLSLEAQLLTRALGAQDKSRLGALWDALWLGTVARAK
jgi:hydroxymethylpyrimidine pyrophosphatase-like HAD family hydrolase